MHNVLYLLSVIIRAGVNTIQCEFHVNIKRHWRSTPVMHTCIWMHRREYLSRTCRHLHIHICSAYHAPMCTHMHTMPKNMHALTQTTLTPG